jgi:hypothetical protein
MITVPMAIGAGVDDDEHHNRDPFVNVQLKAVAAHPISDVGAQRVGKICGSPA